MKKEQRLEVYQKYGGHCAYCGKAIEYKDMQVDHISSRYRHRMNLDGKSEDELDALENFNPSCRMCNFRKGVLTIEQFRAEIACQAATEMKRFQARMSEAYGLIEHHPERKVKFYFEKYYKYLKEAEK